MAEQPQATQIQMLARRVIPTMLCKGRQLVRGPKFGDYSRVVGHALQAARVHAARQVDELCILDVTATVEGRTIDLDLVKELTDGCFVPVSVGGGIRTCGDIDRLLRSGADRVVVGAAGTPAFISEAAGSFGSQAITAVIEHPRRGVLAAAKAVEAGAGEILLIDRLRDGTMLGYDLELIRSFAHLSVPVVACGGCSSYEDMVEAIKAGASAVAVGALFQFCDQTPLGAAQYLKAQGLEARA